jgi:class 3 adenylate cyclase
VTLDNRVKRLEIWRKSHRIGQPQKPKKGSPPYLRMRIGIGTGMILILDCVGKTHARLCGMGDRINL